MAFFTNFSGRRSFLRRMCEPMRCIRARDRSAGSIDPSFITIISVLIGSSSLARRRKLVKLATWPCAMARLSFWKVTRERVRAAAFTFGDVGDDRNESGESLDPFAGPSGPGSWSRCHCRMSTEHTASRVTTTNSSASALTIGLKYASRWK